MTLIIRLGAALALITAALPVALAGETKGCRSDQFWWDDRSCCLPRNSPHSPPQPPPGKSCPHEGWYWHDDQGCCVPDKPSPPPPSCEDKWDWDHDEKCCKPHHPHHPHPSHKVDKKKRRSVSLCPTGLQACPVTSVLAGDYECVDTSVELESCGGCVALGEGQDCSAIEGVWNVGCEKGVCAVYTCAAGYRRSPDGRSCIPL